MEKLIVQDRQPLPWILARVFSYPGTLLSSRWPTVAMPHRDTRRREHLLIVTHLWTVGPSGQQLIHPGTGSLHIGLCEHLTTLTQLGIQALSGLTLNVV